MSIKNPLRRGRVWLYGPDNYEGMPVLYAGKGGDEFGRRTVIVTLRRVGSVVVAYRTCYCRDCAGLRAQTETLEYEHACAMKLYGLTEDEVHELTLDEINAAVDADRRGELNT